VPLLDELHSAARDKSTGRSAGAAAVVRAHTQRGPSADGRFRHAIHPCCGLKGFRIRSSGSCGSFMTLERLGPARRVLFDNLTAWISMNGHHHHHVCSPPPPAQPLNSGSDLGRVTHKPDRRISVSGSANVFLSYRTVRHLCLDILDCMSSHVPDAKTIVGWANPRSAVSNGTSCVIRTLISVISEQVTQLRLGTSALFLFWHPAAAGRGPGGDGPWKGTVPRVGLELQRTRVRSGE
jgi:hypothetical protein